MNRNIRFINASAYQYNKFCSGFIRDNFLPILKNFGITDFAFQRYFNDGRYLLLSNNTIMSEHYFFNIQDPGPLFGQEIIHTPPEKPHYCLWPNMPIPKDPILSALYEYDLWNGFTIYNRYENHIDAYYFSSTKDNSQVRNFYINHIHELNLFIAYFHEKASHQLDSTDEQKLGSFVQKINLTYKKNNLNSYDFRAFLNQKEGNKYLVKTQKGLIPLSKQQFKCLNCALNGMTAKQTSKILKITHRTVETHLNRVKEKTGINYKSEFRQYIKCMLSGE